MLENLTSKIYIMFFFLPYTSLLRLNSENIWLYQEYLESDILNEVFVERQVLKGIRRIPGCTMYLKNARSSTNWPLVQFVLQVSMFVDACVWLSVCPLLLHFLPWPRRQSGHGHQGVASFEKVNFGIWLYDFFVCIHSKITKNAL